MPHPEIPASKTGQQGRGRVLVLAAATASLLLAGFTGTAMAVSGGGYSPYQQGCQPGDSDFATPTGDTYPGCHNTALNVESGGTTNGDPNSNNTKYAQVGVDQSPNDPNSQGTPTPYSIGMPGSSGSPHAFCASANTDGTNSRPASPSTRAEPAGKAANARNGCGDNPNGAGFDMNVDYYEYYCPIAKAAGSQCEATSYGTSTLTGDLGDQVAYQPLVKNGILVYYGMDDNSDNGEHDGLGPYSNSAHQKTNGAQNGSSDGGAIVLIITPANAAATPSQTHPEGLANLSLGECADGICSELTTEQQTVYQGCNAPDSYGQARCQKGTPKNANVYDYSPGGNPANNPSVNTESANCNSGGYTTTSEKACGQSGMDGLRAATPANENTEPGFQLYADPDPQRSPAAPSPFWPTPALYFGTCGLYAGSPATTGQIVGFHPVYAGPVQMTNADGQIAFDPEPGTC